MRARFDEQDEREESSQPSEPQTLGTDTEIRFQQLTMIIKKRYLEFERYKNEIMAMFDELVKMVSA